MPKPATLAYRDNTLTTEGPIQGLRFLFLTFLWPTLPLHPYPLPSPQECPSSTTFFKGSPHPLYEGSQESLLCGQLQYSLFAFPSVTLYSFLIVFYMSLSSAFRDLLKNRHNSFRKYFPNFSVFQALGCVQCGSRQLGLDLWSLPPSTSCSSLVEWGQGEPET